jgi:hypothetical protein
MASTMQGRARWRAAPVSVPRRLDFAEIPVEIGGGKFVTEQQRPSSPCHYSSIAGIAGKGVL